ncbi:MAG: hypothetical protein ACPGUV_11655 [Polyangiales bacterium]
MLSRRVTLLTLWPAACVLQGCIGECGGAIRWVGNAFDEASNVGEGSTPHPVTSGADFLVSGDYQKASNAQTQAASGINADNFFLIEEDSGQRVAAQVTAENRPAAHSCANAVIHRLDPNAPLQVGAQYILVLSTSQVRWKRIDKAAREQSNHAGQPAIVKRYIVE